MIWYAETRRRRMVQIVVDLAMALWIYGWVRVGLWAQDQLGALAGPADPLRDAGTSLSDRMNDVAGTIGGVPLVGDDLTGPFTGAAGVGDNLVAAGDNLQSSVDQVALWTGLAIGGVPIVLVFALWLTLRVRFARRAARVANVRDNPDFLELLALRGLVNTRVDKLGKMSPELIQGWHEGDPAAQKHLAAHELRRVGLRPARL
ncbi:hypothetical protein K0651_09620 [Ornithinimicrobium sp. Arc0846-15]|nr:hypothetical protein [Ornithinimicrobium laminariae]